MNRFVKQSNSINTLEGLSNVKRILGSDHPVGYLSTTGYVHDFSDKRSAKMWLDVTVPEIGPVYAVQRGLYRFKSFSALLEDHEPEKIDHLLFNDDLQLFSTESRTMALTGGNTPHVLEVTAADPVLIEDFEGLNVQKVIPGYNNRFGFITEGGELYIMGRRTRSLELVEVDEEDPVVRFAGIGADFEVVVTELNVWIRGSSKSNLKEFELMEDAFSQLGLPDVDGEKPTETFMSLDIKPESVVDVHCGRYSTILVQNT